MAWKRIERETLPQVADGADWGTPRDVMMRKGEVMVLKTRGHTGWFSRGCTAYYSPQWTLRVKPGYDFSTDLNSGYRVDGTGRMTQEMWLSCLPRIAKAMGLKVAQMPQRQPRGGTLVWE